MVTRKPPADVEPALLVYLEDVADYLDTWTPSDLKDRIAAGEKVLRIKRIGGGLSTTTDDARVSIQAFTKFDAETPRSSHKVLGQVAAKVLEIGDMAMPVAVPDEYGGGKVMFDSGSLDSGPVELPWPDLTVLVVESIFRISTRR